ncbi:MAG: hypothetical protein ACFE0O_05695 [Opitutales bacterium]
MTLFQPRTLAWLIVALLLGGVHGAWLISMATGHVAPGFPYVDGAITISRAGRGDPAIFLFRGTLIPAAVLLVGFWLSFGRWLQLQRELVAGERLPRQTGERWIPWVGGIAALFLILYALFLGTDGDVYTTLRRYGVTVFFGFTLLSQLWAAGAVRSLASAGDLPGREGLSRWLMGLVLFQFTIGLISIFLSDYAWDEDQVENIIEWWFALASCLWFAIVARLWGPGYRIEGKLSETAD